MRLAILTGMYVGVVCSAQIGAQKIVELPWTGEPAPGGAVLIGVSLALVELAHHTAPTRREGWRNALVMIGTGFAASALLAGWIAIVDAWTPAFPGQGFFLLIAFGSLDFFAGQLQAKYAATIVLGVPLVLGIRRLFDRPVPVPAT
jgi:hypothetical protein